MLKILHILSQIPSQTGSGIFFQNMIRQCARAGYEQAAIIGLPQALQNHPVPGLPRKAVMEVLFETEALAFKIPGMSDVMPYESTVFSAMDAGAVERYRNSFMEAVRSAVAWFEPHLILSNHLWVATAAVCEVIRDLPAEMARPSLFAVCHGTDLRQMQLCPDLAPYVAAECGSAAGVFCLNRFQKQEIQRLYGIGPDKLHIIGSGYDSAMFHREGRKKDFHKKTELVYAGKLARSKGLYELIHCMHLLDPEQYRLTIAGRGSGAEAEAILKAAAAPGADIRYVGQLHQSELAELFRQSHILVLPSYYEGLPLVVIEALASGMKVVVNKLQGIQEWLEGAVNDSGRIVYVRMPELQGVDACAPEAVQPYQRELASAIALCSASGDAADEDLWPFYSAIEERSWANVFIRMERVFRP